MAPVESNPFKRVTFEFNDGAILEVDLHAIRSVEISLEIDRMATMTIEFLVDMHMAAKFMPEQLPAPVDRLLPARLLPDPHIDGGPDDPS